jgi:hypothetical protein
VRGRAVRLGRHRVRVLQREEGVGRAGDVMALPGAAAVSIRSGVGDLPRLRH